MTAVFCFFAVLLVLSSVKSLTDGTAYRRFFRTETSRKLNDTYRPFASVIVPCRGVDPGLRENLSALSRLEYPDYEIVFVTDDDSDPSVAVIKEVIAAAPRPAQLVIAPRATQSSQKVENLREAVLHARPESEVFVFVDSDARPSPEWLHALVEPLGDPDIGASTGYRWFIGERLGLASELRSVWNASIASALGPNVRGNFCWGGSTAIRRDTFDRLSIRDRWLGTLSDDFVVTRTLSQAGLGIRFVPRAMAATIEACTFGELLEFTTRQMKITRVYMPQLWVLTLIGSVLHTGVIAASVAAIVAAPFSVLGAVAIITIALVAMLGTAKAYVRLKAVTLAMPGHRSRLARQFVPQLTLWFVTPIIFLYNSLAAGFSRRIRWRSTVYELKSPSETVIIAE